MSKNICSICTAPLHYVFSAQVLAKHNADYFYCESCGYLSVSSPHWLEDAYSSAIADADTGLVLRNFSIASKLASFLYWGMGERGRGVYLDGAGGYGMLTRLMRDYGFNFYWSDKYCENVLAKGFEYKKELGFCRAVTSMEVLEHVTDPLGYIRGLMDAVGASTFVFTTELFEGRPPNPQDWWYYSLPTGQHIGFFQSRTLRFIAQVLEMNFYSANGLHVFTKERISSSFFRIISNPYFVRASAPILRRLIRSKTIDDHKSLMGKIC